MTHPAPAPRYLGPAAHDSGPGNKPIHRIVLHSTVSACVKGGAESVARYFRSPAAGGSAHYVADPGQVVQVVFDDVIAWHAPPNDHSLGVEMCDMPSTTSKARWKDASHKAMLEHVVDLVAQLCVAYDVPAVWVDAQALKAGQHGVTTHNQVSLAFGQSTHWDPGAWPRVRFMRAVRRRVRELQRGPA